jgi:hypothetical protein
MTNIEHTIRSAVPQDAARLAQVARRGIPGYPFEEVYHPESVERHILSSDEQRLVAELPGMGVIATAVLGVGRMAEIKRVVVDPTARGVGVAKEMVGQLADRAKENEQIPWSDVRADQIGMQRAALAAGMRAISLEPGKHVVYEHPSPDGDSGPARETMVHMTSLKLDDWALHRDLRYWPQHLVHKLVENMMKAHQPKPKDVAWSSYFMKDAAGMRERVTEAIDRFDHLMGREALHPDIEVLTIEEMKVVVIKPDNSGFIVSEPNGGVGVVVSQLMKQIGLDIVTHYSPAGENVTRLSDAGMEPAMVRPWQEHPDVSPEWQVGWRAVGAGFNEILHPINLDPTVRQQLLEFQQGILSNGTIKSHLETIL